jgi:hypothetical protein
MPSFYKSSIIVPLHSSRYTQIGSNQWFGQGVWEPFKGFWVWKVKVCWKDRIAYKLYHQIRWEVKENWGGKREVGNIAQNCKRGAQNI